MNKPSVTNEPHSLTTPGDLIALSQWLKQIGRSNVTGWRWTKAGLIHPVNIRGQFYLTKEDIAQFIARAVAGELATPSSGAATVGNSGRKHHDAQNT